MALCVLPRATDQRLDDSQFIFPEPSSSDPPSPYQSSQRSALSWSSLSETRSRDGSVPSTRPRARSAHSHVDVDSESWEFTTRTESNIDDRASEYDDSERLDRWDVLAPRRQPSSSRVWQSRSAPSRRTLLRRRVNSLSPRRYIHRHRATSSASAHSPIIHIPLLSFLLSFFAVDRATIDLVTRSTCESALFPGNTLYSDHTATHEDETSSHGFARLVAFAKESQSLKDGIQVACDPSITPTDPFRVSVPSFSTLWSFIGGVWVDGRKAVTEIWWS